MQGPQFPEARPGAGMWGVLKLLAGVLALAIAALGMLLIADAINGDAFWQLAGKAVAITGLLAIVSVFISVLTGRRQ